MQDHCSPPSSLVHQFTTPHVSTAAGPLDSSAPPQLSTASDSRFVGSPRSDLSSTASVLTWSTAPGVRSTRPVSYRRPDGLIQLYDLATQLARQPKDKSISPSPPVSFPVALFCREDIGDEPRRADQRRLDGLIINMSHAALSTAPCCRCLASFSGSAIVLPRPACLK
jgi:hypothetical protein